MLYLRVAEVPDCALGPKLPEVEVQAAKRIPRSIVSSRGMVGRLGVECRGGGTGVYQKPTTGLSSPARTARSSLVSET